MKIIDNFDFENSMESVEPSISYDITEDELISLESEYNESLEMFSISTESSLGDAASKLMNMIKKLVKYIMGKIRSSFSKINILGREINKLDKNIKMLENKTLATEAEQMKLPFSGSLMVPLKKIKASVEDIKKLNDAVSSLEVFVSDFSYTRGKSPDFDKFTTVIEKLGKTIKSSDEGFEEADLGTLREVRADAESAKKFLSMQLKRLYGIMNEFIKNLDSSTKKPQIDINDINQWKDVFESTSKALENKINGSADFLSKEVAKINNFINNNLSKSGNESMDSKIIAAVMEEYGIEGVASIIKNLASK